MQWCSVGRMGMKMNLNYLVPALGGFFPDFISSHTMNKGGSLSQQIRRIPTPVALAIGIICGLIFSRLLSWTTVGIWHTLSHAYALMCAIRQQRLCGVVATSLRVTSRRVDTIFNYQH